MSILSGIFGSALNVGLQQPATKQLVQDIEFVLGINETSRARWNFYRENYSATQYPRGRSGTFPAYSFRQPIQQSFGQLLTGFNQSPLPTSDSDVQRVIWETLRNNCRRLAIDIGDDALPGAETPATLPGEFEALQWRRLIDMSAAAAPLGSVVRDYYRSQVLADASVGVSREELQYNLQRAQLRRGEDRERILRPFASWGLQEAIRLSRLGAIDFNEYISLLEASGIVRDEDKKFVDYLRLVIPDPSALVAWAARRLWDQGLADRYKLDEGFDLSPIAQFFAQRTAGNAPGVLLPDQPDGSTDWVKLSYRAGRPLPGFAQALEMQWRLRPDEEGSPNSVLAGVPAWTEENTRDMLAIEGFSEPIIERLLALSVQPINIRIINQVLLQALKHDDVAAIADEVFGRDFDWVKSSYLDHGYSDGVATLAAAGIRARADDEANAERIDSEKRLRAESRKDAIRRYEIGLLTYDDCLIVMQDRYFTQAMAEKELSLVRQGLDDQVIVQGIKALHAAWIEGKMSADGIKAGLAQIGISAEQKDRYIAEWTWERTEKVRVASTGEILAALKAGLMTQAQAQARLVNLGWSAPDALLEIALVQQGLAVSSERLAHEQAAAAALKAKREQADLQREKKANDAQEAKARAEAEKTAGHIALAGPEQLRLSAQYAARIHAAQAAIDKAVDPGQQAIEQAALARAVEAYENYLIGQIKLRQQGLMVQDEIGPVDAPGAPTNNPATGLALATVASVPSAGPGRPANPGASAPG